MIEFQVVVDHNAEEFQGVTFSNCLIVDVNIVLLIRFVQFEMLPSHNHEMAFFHGPERVFVDKLTST